MGEIMRHAFAILVLPFMVTVIIPTWIARASSVGLVWSESAVEWIVGGIGLAPMLVGVGLFMTCVRRFARGGRGTLAPWDPPTRLVIEGPYAHVRHPMISAVVLVLVAEAMLLRSWPHLVWAGSFAAVNAIYLPLVEEPGLRRRFGSDYDDYAAHVPRLIPRVTPFSGSAVARENRRA